MIRRRIITLAGATALALPLLAAPASAQDASSPAIVRDGNEWHLRDSLSGGPATTSFRYGATGDTGHMLCDWNGDGTETPGVVRVDGSMEWLLRDSHRGGAADHRFFFGREGDVPVCGDWNGDGTQTPGIVREHDNGSYEWHLRHLVSGGAADESFFYGRDDHPGDLPPAWPVVGDWNGNGIDSVGIVQGHEDGQMQWQLRDVNSGGPANYDFVFYDDAVWGDHLEIHVPITGDWNGDGSDGIGVTAASESNPRWLLRDSPSAGLADHSFVYGDSHLNVTLSWR